MNILTLEGVSAGYGGVPAVRDISLEVVDGCVLALLGPNGAGKSTLTRVITGLVATDRGDVHFAGQRVTKWSTVKRVRAGMVLIPEERGIFPTLSVEENLMLAVAIDGQRTSRRDAVARSYELFPALKPRRQQRAGSLSGGEQQMLSLARVLVTRPRLVVADELSHGLAPKLVDMALEALMTAKRNGVTVVLVEQFVHRALAIADNCVMMRRGRIVWQGDARMASNEVVNRYWGDDTAAEGEQAPSSGMRGSDCIDS